MKYDYTYESRRRSEESKVHEELSVLMNTYGLDRNFAVKVAKFYYTEPSVKIGDITNNLNLVKYILDAYGYSEEETLEFIKRNKRMLLSRYVDFRYRLGVFNRFGLLETVLFKLYGVLTEEFTKTYSFGTRDIYASICFNNRNGKSIESIENIVGLKSDELKSAKEMFPLTKEMLTMMDNELIENIKAKKKENFLKKLEERKQGRI